MTSWRARPTGTEISHFFQGGNIMLYWTAVFLVIAIVAALLGFTGVAAGAASIAQILFFIFLILFIVSLIFGISRRRRV